MLTKRERKYEMHPTGRFRQLFLVIVTPLPRVNKSSFTLIVRLRTGVAGNDKSLDKNWIFNRLTFLKFDFRKISVL